MCIGFVEYNCVMSFGVANACTEASWYFVDFAQASALDAISVVKFLLLYS
jgi:hypothetical protein